MITAATELQAIVARSREAGRLALDTEFWWERTYFPQLGVVQIAVSADDCHLVDALALDDWTPLAEVLADPAVTKILHDAQQDLTILRRTTGAYPRNVFDTRLAAGFVGLPCTLSLAALLKALLDLDLADDQTRSDWLQRPLTAAQVRYAIEDVQHLPRVHDLIWDRLRELGREAWIQEELRTYDDPGLYEEADPAAQYRRIKGCNGLSARRRAALRELTAWRELEAMRRNLPRNRVMRDEKLLALAKHLPQSVDDLRKHHARLAGTSYGGAVLEAIGRALAGPVEHRPPRDRDPRAEVNLKARVDRALAHTQRRCAEAGVDPQIVATRAEMTALVLAGPRARPEQHRMLRGWRRELLGDSVRELTALPRQGQLGLEL